MSRKRYKANDQQEGKINKPSPIFFHIKCWVKKSQSRKSKLNFEEVDKTEKSYFEQKYISLVYRVNEEVGGDTHKTSI